MHLLYKKTFFLLIVLLTSLFTSAQQDWKLKSDKENIKIYTSPSTDSKIKALKVVCTVDATLSQMAAVLLDVNAGAEWVYKTKSASVIKKISPVEIIYYSEIDMPWPLSNRDFVVRIKLAQNATTKIVSVDTENLPDYIPVKSGIVRVRHSDVKWTLKPIGKNQVLVEYMLVVDPGGAIPAWLVNMFSTKGPFECFKSLKEQIKKPAYAHAQLPFVVNL